MSTVFSFLSIILSIINAEYIYKCSQSPCEIEANASTVVIADNTITKLTVKCSTKNQCKKQSPLIPGLIVYSSSIETTISCYGEDSCIDTHFYFGVTPHGYQDLLFKPNNTKSISFNCNNKQACKSIHITSFVNSINGLFIDTPDLTLNPSYTASLMTGNIKCNTGNCIINCKDNIVTCKDLKCIESNTNIGGCKCEGLCPKDLTIQPTPNVPTLKPTPYPTTTNAPTMVTSMPTPSPTHAIVNMECPAVGPCYIVPVQHSNILCNANKEECIVICEDATYCHEGVTITANSRTVVLECYGKGTCHNVLLIVANSEQVTVDCFDDISCGNMEIRNTNPNAIVNINAVGPESFKTGKLYCFGDCTLNCLGRSACTSTVYQCLTDKQRCKCVGNHCPTPAMETFGDMSCKNSLENCVIQGSGDLRIVATKEVKQLTVICNEYPHQCKATGGGLRVFSAANKTIIKANGPSACEDCLVYIGGLPTSLVPKGFAVNDFASADNVELDMDCNGLDACKKVEVYAGNNAVCNVYGGQESSLDNSIMECDGCNTFKLACFDYYGCINSRMNCFNGQCSCVSIPFMFDNDTNATMMTLPQDTCPVINNIGVSTIRMKGNGVNGNVNNGNNENSLKVIIPIIIIGCILLFGIVFGIYNYNKSYKRIDSVNGSNMNMIEKNTNIYNSCQLEMH